MTGLPVPSALVLLAGSLRPSRFLQAIRRSPVDLPLRPGLSLLGAWLDQAARLGRVLGAAEWPVRLVLDRGAPEPAGPVLSEPASLRIERDPLEFRGAAGVLGDLARDYGDGDWLLVAAATQIPAASLVDEWRALAGAGADVALLARPGGEPTGLSLVRCGALRDVPGVGFVDLKEQALPRIAAKHRVKVVFREGPPVTTVREPAGYLRTVRAFRDYPEWPASLPDPFAERWEPEFRLAEEGAEVAEGAALHDSVVLRGGRVGPGAVAIRSVIAPGGALGPGRTAVEQVLAAPASGGVPGRERR